MCLWLQRFELEQNVLECTAHFWCKSFAMVVMFVPLTRVKNNAKGTCVSVTANTTVCDVFTTYVTCEDSETCQVMNNVPDCRWALTACTWQENNWPESNAGSMSLFPLWSCDPGVFYPTSTILRRYCWGKNFKPVRIKMDTVYCWIEQDWCLIMEWFQKGC